MNRKPRASQKDIPVNAHMNLHPLVPNATSEERISALEDQVAELIRKLEQLTRLYNSHHHSCYDGGMSEPCAIHQVPR